MKLSVVIPVFRVEATLNRCVESVLRQDVEGMEVILVDDGSPDRCPQLCDAWAQRDSRIRVIHKNNGGLSDARNAGIDMAIGDYITFVDSDDWLDNDTYAPLLRQIGDCDLLEYSIADRLQLQDAVYEDISIYWQQTRAYTHTYAWNKIYRRSLFANVCYPKGKVFEDVYTLPLLLRQTKKLRTSSHGSYHYWQNPQGITATADGRDLAQLLEAHLGSLMPVDDTYYLYMANIQMDVWELTGADILLPRRHLRIGPFKGYKKPKALLLNILGIKKLCRISKLIHYLKKPSRL